MLYGTPVSGIDVAAQQFWKVEGEEGTYLLFVGLAGLVLCARWYFVLDEAGAKLIVVEALPPTPEWCAIADRLERASANERMR
jgi:hypothetical protein